MTHQPSLPGNGGTLDMGLSVQRQEKSQTNKHKLVPGQAMLQTYVGPSLGKPCPWAFLGLLWVRSFPEKDLHFK